MKLWNKPSRRWTHNHGRVDVAVWLAGCVSGSQPLSALLPLRDPLPAPLLLPQPTPNTHGSLDRLIREASHKTRCTDAWYASTGLLLPMASLNNSCSTCRLVCRGCSNFIRIWDPFLFSQQHCLLFPGFVIFKEDGIRVYSLSWFEVYCLDFIRY